MTLLLLATIAAAGEPIPAEFVRPLVLDGDGNLVAGPSLADMNLEPGDHSLSNVYADWLDTVDEPDSSEHTLTTGIRLYTDTSTSTVYACTCPFRCSSAGCDYIVEAGFGGLSTMSCRGECEALETCTAPAPGTEQPSDETETSKSCAGVSPRPTTRPRRSSMGSRMSSTPCADAPTRQRPACQSAGDSSSFCAASSPPSATTAGRDRLRRELCERVHDRAGDLLRGHGVNSIADRVAAGQRRSITDNERHNDRVCVSECGTVGTCCCYFLSLRHLCIVGFHVTLRTLYSETALLGLFARPLLVYLH